MAQKEILRMCLLSREMKDKRSLLRIVRNREGQIELDLSGKKNGRGAYLSADLITLEEAKKRRALEHLGKHDDYSALYAEIEAEIQRRNQEKEQQRQDQRRKSQGKTVHRLKLSMKDLEQLKKKAKELE